MKLSNLTQQQKESIKHLGILELFEGCDKNIEYPVIKCGEIFARKIYLCDECKAKIQQAQKDFKREAEEVREMIEFLENENECLIRENENENEGIRITIENIGEQIQQLKSKQDALILASELEE